MAHLYVSSSGTESILRYHGISGVFLGTFVPPESGGLDSPQGLVFGPDGHLYVSSRFTNNVLRYDGNTGVFLGVFVDTESGGLIDPRGLVFGPDGHLYVSSGFTDSILRYDGSSGAFLGAFVDAGIGGLDGPRGLVFGPGSHLYVSSFWTHSILKYHSQTGAFINKFVSFDKGGLTFPTGLVFQTLERPSLPLTVIKNGAGLGTVLSSPSGIDCGAICASEFLTNTEITLTAVPAMGQVFVGWQGGGCSGTGPCVVTLVGPLTLTAIFEPQPTVNSFLLAVIRQGDGTGNVISDSTEINCGPTCTADVTAGTVETLRATAAAGSVFVGWGGEGCSGLGACIVTMNQPRTLTAVFEPAPAPAQFPLFISKIGTGSGHVASTVGGIDCGSICGSQLPAGTAVTLNADPDSNSMFVGWQGSGCSGATPCTFTMTQAQSITAEFNRIPMPRTLTVQKRGNGSGTISSVPPRINCGTNCTADFGDNAVVELTVAAESGSNFVGWVGGICRGTAPCKVTMNEDRLIQALINSDDPPPGE